MKRLLTLFALSAFLCGQVLAAEKPNVLFIMVDDLRDYGGVFTRAVVKTPNLDRLKLWDKTVVIFLGDHGYHTGERQWWNKNTLFDRSCRAPLLIAAPGVKGGQVCPTPVEFVDLYPTVVNFCGLTAPHKLAGQSLRPLLANPRAPHKDAAFTLVTRGPDRFGQSVRTARWRFTQWSDGVLELYDHDADPEETRNLSKEAAHAATIAEMKALLRTLPPWPAKK